jgi:hypothetical protein
MLGELTANAASGIGCRSIAHRPRPTRRGFPLLGRRGEKVVRDATPETTLSALVHGGAPRSDRTS